MLSSLSNRFLFMFKQNKNTTVSLQQSIFSLHHSKVNPIESTISRHDGVQNVPPRLMKLLMLLVNNYHKTVSREEILAELWPNTIVTDESINRAVADLRKILGDSPNTSNIIKTITKQGYKLTLEPSYSKPNHRNYFKSYLIKLFMLLVLLIVSWQVVNFFKFGIQKEGIQYTQSRLATSGTFNKKPDISENGNLLVSERYDEGRSSIWLYDLNTDSEKKLFPNSFENFNSPTISNDNAKLAYMRSHRDPVTKALHCKIEIYHLILDSIRKLADCNPYSGADLSWVKGDKKILASRQNALTGINELIFVNVETGASEFIVAPETSQSFYRFPRISPSGKLIAMLDSSSTGSYSKLVIYDIENVTLRHVNTHSHSVVHVGWGENDDELFYAEIAGKNTGLWRFDVEEQQHTLILNESVTEFDYDVTNDTFIVGVSRYATSIKRIQNGVESVVIDDDAFERHMQVSPNGKMLAYVSNRNGDDNIWMKSLDLNSLHRVTNDDVSDYVSLHFSNDNKFLAYLVMEDMRSVLVILDVKNSFQEVYRQVDVQSVAWSKDSQSIYTYGSNLEINTNELHQVSLPHFSKQFLTNTSELHRIETSGSQGLIVQPKAWGPIHKLCCLDKGYVDINQSSVLIDFEWIFKWDVIGDELSILKLENDYNLLNFYALNENENKTADLIIPEKKRVYFYDYNVATQSLYYVNFESEHNALLKLTKVIH